MSILSPTDYLFWFLQNAEKCWKKVTILIDTWRYNSTLIGWLFFQEPRVTHALLSRCLSLCSSGRTTPSWTLSCPLLVAAILILLNSQRKMSSLETSTTSRWCLATTLWPQTEVSINCLYVWKTINFSVLSSNEQRIPSSALSLNVSLRVVLLCRGCGSHRVPGRCGVSRRSCAALCQRRRRWQEAAACGGCGCAARHCWNRKTFGQHHHHQRAWYGISDLMYLHWKKSHFFPPVTFQSKRMRWGT